MSVYDVDYSLQSDNLNNPRFRLPNITAYLHILMKPLQWARDNMFNDYLLGSVQALWIDATVYNYGNKVQYGFAIYECQLTHTSSLTNGLTPLNQVYWYKIQDNFIGLNERFAYTGQKLIMEYALNRQFQVVLFSLIQWDDGVVTAPPYTQIYITNNVATPNGFFLSPSDNQTYTVAPSDTITNAVAPTDYNVPSIWFTVHVPNSVVTQIQSLYPSSTTWQSVIGSVVDRLVESGRIYTIVNY